MLPAETSERLDERITASEIGEDGRGCCKARHDVIVRRDRLVMGRRTRRAGYEGIGGVDGSDNAGRRSVNEFDFVVCPGELRPPSSTPSLNTRHVMCSSARSRFDE